MKNLRNWALLISALCLVAIPSRAQTSGISGTVKVQHRPLGSAGVSAYLLNAEGNKTVSQWATVSAGDGRFALRSLPYGTYAVIVRYQGKIIYQAKIQLNSPVGQQLGIDIDITKSQVSETPDSGWRDLRNHLRLELCLSEEARGRVSGPDPFESGGREDSTLGLLVANEVNFKLRRDAAIT